MKSKRILAIILTVLLMVSCFSACGNKEGMTSSTELGELTTTDTYPQVTDVTLRHWGSIDSGVLSNYTNFGETEIAKYLEEATGVHVEYEHPVTGQENAAFNIMLNAKDLPDIISWSWTSYPGGPDTAIKEGIIAPLNEYYEKVSPNLTNLLKEHPEWEKELLTDGGNFFQYPMLKEDAKLLTYISYFIRKDLLDRAGLDIPVTLDDWEEALYAFRDMGIEVPLSVRIDNGYLKTMGPFMGCFGIMGDFYQDNGTVKYGPYEKNFKDYVLLLRKWYKDGILDKEFADSTKKRRSALVTNGRNGATEGSVGGDFGTWLSAITKESGIQYVPTTVPVLKEGDRPMWTQSTSAVMSGVAISATSKHKELAARYLDYSYSEEGHFLNNYGKEGVTYTMEEKDGKTTPTYMSWMKDSKENGGKTFSEVLSGHTRSAGGPFMQCADYIEQLYDNPMQKLAFSKWDSDVLKYKLPTIYMTVEEAKEYSDIMTPIDTYREETIAQIIADKLPESEIDVYFEKLKELKIERAIEIKQAAYDRYMARSK